MLQKIIEIPIERIDFIYCKIYSQIDILHLSLISKLSKWNHNQLASFSLDFEQFKHLIIILKEKGAE